MVKPVWNNAQRVNHQNFAKKTHPCAKKNLAPRAVLLKSGLVSINTARQNISKTAVSVNTARQVNTARPKAVVNAVKGNNVNAVKASACWGNPQMDLQDQGGTPKEGKSQENVPLKLVVGIKSLLNATSITAILIDVNAAQLKLVLLENFNENYSKCLRLLYKVNTAKGVNAASEEVSTAELLKEFDLLKWDQHCVVFNDTECIVLSPNFKLIDESQVLLRVPRKNNMYSVDLKNIVPKGGLTCLFTKATSDESKLWHRRLGHLNFKTMNKLVKGNLVRGLPSKVFENDQTCVACQKGKQHRASCKSKTENSISLPLHLLHMDLFGLTFVKSLMKKMYCLVVIDDYSRFTWVFFLATKDETSGILKSFINGIENLVDHKVKVIRCDNGTEFKNKEMNQFCEMKGILRQFSVARTPQQNGVIKRRNRILIEVARTMLADSKLPTTFWVEAVNTTCYVQNRVLVVKTHNKTPYELFHGRTPTLSFMRPFRCPVTILNTIDHLGKFDEGFFVGYSLNSKSFRVFNSRIRIVEENLHIRFSESTPNAVGSGPDWLFDIDALTRTMNYEPIVAGTQSNGFAGTKASDNAGQARKETKPVKDYILLPLWTADPPFSQNLKSSHDDGSKPPSDDGNKVNEDLRKDSESNDQEKEENVNSTNNVNAASTNEVNDVGGKISIELPVDSNMPALEDYSIFDFIRDDEDDGVEANMNNFAGKAKKSVKLMMEKLFGMELELMLLNALVDGKKVIISEASVRRDLKLKDEEGIGCLPNSTIFEQLALMGYEKTTAWNEFSSTMESAIICLATNQKFNFSKYIFESMVRNLDNLSGKFLMYPRFVQVFPEHQLGNLLTHNRIYDAPSHTKKIFGNIKRVGKGFSVRVTPLFSTMVVQNQSELGEGLAMPTDPHHTPTIIESSTQPQKTQKPRKPNRKDTQLPQPSGPTKHVADEAVHKKLGNCLVRAATTASSLEVEHDSGGGLKRQETMRDTIDQTRFENVSKLSNDSLLSRGQNENVVEEIVDVAQVSIAATTVTITIEEITLAQALEALKTSKTQGERNLGRHQRAIEDEDQLKLDEEMALKLQAEIDEEERIVRAEEEKINEANIALG
ncbi:putative ribonuclease H-like domain-containing protein [Tanacetum coccineum]